MQYSPKLKKARQEIEAILKKHDIAGIIFLHTPGYAEVSHDISPSYSCARFDGSTLRIQNKLNETCNGDRKVWRQRAKDTSNMLRLFTDTIGPIALGMMNSAELVDKTLGIDHETGNFLDDITLQN